MRWRARGETAPGPCKNVWAGSPCPVHCSSGACTASSDLMRSSAIRLADNHVFRFNLPLRPFQGYQPTGRLEETAKRTQSSPGTIASVADAVLVNASTTKDGICFKEKQARYLARQTFLHCCLAASAAAKRVDATPESRTSSVPDLNAKIATTSTETTENDGLLHFIIQPLKSKTRQDLE